MCPACDESGCAAVPGGQGDEKHRVPHREDECGESQEGGAEKIRQDVLGRGGAGVPGVAETETHGICEPLTVFGYRGGERGGGATGSGGGGGGAESALDVLGGTGDQAEQEESSAGYDECGEYESDYNNQDRAGHCHARRRR